MFGAISGQFPAKKFKTKGDGLHGRGFKQFHVSQYLATLVADVPVYVVFF